MRYLSLNLLLGGVLALTAHAQTIAQHASNNVSSSEVAVTLTNPVGSGHTLLAFAVGAALGEPDNALTITDTTGNLWTPITSVTDNGNSKLWAWIAPSAIAGTPTFKATYTNASNYVQLHVFELSDVAASPLDTFGVGQSGAAGGTFTVTTDAGASQANEIIFGYFNDWNAFNTWTPGPGFTIQTPNAGGPSAESIVETMITTTASGPQSASTSAPTANNKLGIVVAIKGSAAPPPTQTPAAKIRQGVYF